MSDSIEYYVNVIEVHTHTKDSTLNKDINAIIYLHHPCSLRSPSTLFYKILENLFCYVADNMHNRKLYIFLCDIMAQNCQLPLLGHAFGVREP